MAGCCTKAVRNEGVEVGSGVVLAEVPPAHIESVCTQGCEVVTSIIFGHLSYSCAVPLRRSHAGKGAELEETVGDEIHHKCASVG